MNRNSNHLGPLLDEQIKGAGLTQESFAATVGAYQPQVSRWVRGKITPSSRWLNTVAMALNLSDQERVALHRAAAKDAGWEIDLS